MTHRNKGPDISSLIGTKSNQAAAIVGLIVATFLALSGVATAYVAFITPPTGDMWGYINQTRGIPLWDDFLRYLTGYFSNNPRLGQMFLHIAGRGPDVSALVSATSYLMLIILAGLIACRFQAYPRRGLTPIASLIALGTLVFCGKEVGQAFFYVPYAANYVAGFGLLLLFVAAMTSEKWAENTIAMWLLGLVAGLTNEHTVPAFLALGALILFLSGSRVISLPILAGHIAGYCGLLVGYLALFFAPGQAVRYGEGAESRGISALLADPIGRILETLSLLPQRFWLAWMISAIVLLGLIALRARPPVGDARGHWGPSACFLIVSLGMAITAAASPFLVQRLMFASYASLGIAVAAICMIAPFRIVVLPLASAASIIIMYNFFAEAIQVHQQLSNAFNRQAQEIRSKVEAGQLNLNIAPYPFQWGENLEFVRPERFSVDHNDRLNKLRSEYFGAETISFQ